MKTRPLLSCELKNGLTLLCIDQSKKIAVDRWYICVFVQISIPVEKKWFFNHRIDEETFQNISGALGESIIFKQKKERNFVSEALKEPIIKEICDSASEMGIKYFSRDDFPARYILKVFADQQRQYKKI
jgi:hypothetical protein